MSTEVERVYRAYNDAENAHDLEATGRLVASNLTVSINGVPQLASAADDDRANAELFAAYPDYARQVVEVIAAGDRGAVRWRMVGTPAPGSDRQRLDVHGCSVITVRSGRIVDAHLYVDAAVLSAVLPGTSSG